MSNGLKDALNWLNIPDLASKTRVGYIDMFEDEDTQEIPRDVFGEPLYTITKCECGAKHTSAPNLHLRFCPLFTNPMGD